MSNLSPDIEQYIQSQLATGAFKDRDALLEEAIRLWKQRQEDREFIRREVNLGVDEAESGQVVSGDEVFDRLERKAEALAKRPHNK